MRDGLQIPLGNAGQAIGAGALPLTSGVTPPHSRADVSPKRRRSVLAAAAGLESFSRLSVHDSVILMSEYNLIGQSGFQPSDRTVVSNRTGVLVAPIIGVQASTVVGLG